MDMCRFTSKSPIETTDGNYAPIGLVVEFPCYGPSDLDIDGFFLAIGHHPNSTLFTKWLETDEAGYIKTVGDTPCTAVEGVYAAGDVADPRYRQAIIAAGSGAKAAMEAEKYLKAHC